jgi:putative hemolysin
VEKRLTGAGQAEVFLDRPQRLILSSAAALAMLDVLCGVLIGSAYPRPADATIAILVFALVVLVVGIAIPRAIARRWATALLPVLLPLLRALDIVVAPIRLIARWAARRVAGGTSDGEPEHRDDIEDLLREGELEGVGEKAEIAIITGVVHFGDKTVKQVMRPRSEVFALDISLPPREIAVRIAQSAYSRVPVYEGTLDKVIGMVHAFDVLKAGSDHLPTVRPVAQAMITERCNELLFRMLRAGFHLAIVQDENRALAGIVTLEDLFEELVGDIRDEHDEPQLPRPAAAV